MEDGSARDGFDLLGEPITYSQAAVGGPVWEVPKARHKSANKILQCPIHNQMRFDPLSLAVIDTYEFQRLRELKQLGLTSYVYPSANHTRFDHSLGVGHLAQKWASHIYSFQGNEVSMDHMDITCVTLAGLCHDLGHGPFSHVFDRELLARKGITNWEHEDMSCNIFENIINQIPERADGLTSLDSDDVKRVQRMIHVEKAGNMERQEKGFLYSIVANKTNGIDVDKFDYLARDSYHCGVKISFDHNRTMAFSKVLGQEICFRSSQYDDLFELFHSRQRMHRKVYTHRKAKSVEFMVVDALLAADEFLHLTDKINDPVEFVTLDDSLLKMIENFGHRFIEGLDRDKEHALLKAQGIIRRLRRRDLYKYVNEVKIPRVGPRPHDSSAAAEAQYKDLVEKIKREATPENLVQFHRGSDVRLSPDDVIFSVINIDYAAKGKNPMDKVLFFDDLGEEHPRTINKHDVSHMFMEVFQEHTLRLYSRNSDQSVRDAMNNAFEQWQKRYLPSQNLITPRKPKAPRPEGENGNGSSQGPEHKRPRSLMPDLDKMA